MEGGRGGLFAAAVVLALAHFVIRQVVIVLIFLCRGLLGGAFCQSLSPAGGMLTLLLMLTGGNSGSTAGGAKATTLLLVVLTAVSILKGEEDVHLFGRRIENDLLRRACSIVVVYLTLGALATLAICAMQPEFTLQQVLIEVFSAIDTVGLTAGITRELNTASRILMILLMYAGRLGSMTFMILLTRRKPPAPVQYPTDKILVG